MSETKGRYTIEKAGLKPDTQNANQGTQRGRGLLEKSLRKLGAGRSILVDKDGNVIAGNKTLEGAAEIDLPVRIVETDGTELVVVKRTDLDLYSDKDKRARQLAYADNKVAEIDLSWKPEQIAVDFTPLELGEWGFDNVFTESKDTEPQIDRAAELNEKWQVKTGDLWQIGPHRLLCGDSTKREDVERVMAGEKARMVFSDPPYNVSYQDNESVESLKARNRRTDGLVVSNDSMTDEEFDKFLTAFMELFPLIKGGSFYLCSPPGNPETQFRNALNCVSGLSLRECIVWVKDIFVFGRQDYHWRHETILYGWNEGAAHYFIDDHTQDTVWEIERPRVSKEHPTMKPVALPEKAIRNSSLIGEIIYEPFAGSGTTLVACQNLGRKCRAIEISPNYCAVILERMFQAFGIKGERIE